MMYCGTTHAAAESGVAMHTGTTLCDVVRYDSRSCGVWSGHDEQRYELTNLKVEEKKVGVITAIFYTNIT